MNKASAQPDRPAPKPRGLELRFASDPAMVAAVRRALESLSTANGFDEQSAWEVGLCVNEALANVIRHAYRGAIDRPIEVKAEYVAGRLCIDIRDWGSGENPAARAAVAARASCAAATYDPLTPGGLGLICLRQLMDRVDFFPQPDGMLLSLEKQPKRHPPRTVASEGAVTGHDGDGDGAVK